MTINKLAQHLNLSNLLEPAAMLPGAGLHKIWHFKTSTGEYVAKEINPHVVEKEFFFEEYERSERIADFFKCNKIPAVAALKFREHYLHQQDDSWFIVYPWVAGHLLTPEQITEVHAAKIANLFSQMHHLHGDLFKEELTVRYDLFDPAHWQEFLKKTDNETLKNLEHTILIWNEKYQAVIPQLNKNLVVTHCDMHYLNVLWNQEYSPHIIDWESAGLFNPMMEVIGYGLEWAGIVYGVFNPHICTALINAYKKHRPNADATSIEDAFYGCLGHCVLGWTEFNLRRLLGEISNDPHEINLGKEIIYERMIPCLDYLNKNEEMLIRYLNDLCQPNSR